MKYISFRLEQDSVDDLLNAMKALYPLEANITVAKGMKLLANGLIKGKMNTTTNTDVVATDDFIKTTCYLTPNQRLSLEKAAKKHGWTLSRECRYRLQTTIENELDFFDQELLMMNRCRNAIDKIGRNFHYIIMNNENRIMDKDGFHEDVTQLKNQLEQLKSQFEKYIKLCKGRSVSNKVKI